MKRVWLILFLLALAAIPARAQTQGCAVNGSATDGSIQSYAFCQPLVISGRNAGGWIALNRTGDQSNSETQCYSPGNVTIQNGLLTLIAQSKTTTCHYWPANTGVASETQAFTSAFVQWNSFNFTFGDILIRAKGPSNIANGGWPAIWMLGSDCERSSKVTADNATFNGKTCNWHLNGSEEIDIFEQTVANGLTSSTCHAFLNSATSSASYNLSDSSVNWHVYELRWTASALQWWLDGVQQAGCDFSTSVPSTPMFLQINMAMTSTATSTGLPVTMQVDWVKVCQPSPCSGNGGNIIFYDDFITPVSTSLLRPLARVARLAGTVPAPGTTLIQGVIGR